MKIKTLAAALFILCGLRCFAADDTPRPEFLALNRGMLDRDAIRAAEKLGFAKMIKDDQNETVVQHLRWEIFENSKSTTRDQTTVFMINESRWYQTLTGNRPLTNVSARYVILKFDGKAASASSWVITFNSTFAANGGTIWTRKAEKGPNCTKFAEQLPAWAKTQLAQTSGFLDQNPSGTIVDWTKTEDEVVGSFLLDAVDVLPLPELKLPIEIAVGIAKSKLLTLLKNSLRNNELKWGCSDKVLNSKLAEFGEKYEKIGRNMWDFPSR